MLRTYLMTYRQVTAASQIKEASMHLFLYSHSRIMMDWDRAMEGGIYAQHLAVGCFNKKTQRSLLRNHHR